MLQTNKQKTKKQSKNCSSVTLNGKKLIFTNNDEKHSEHQQQTVSPNEKLHFENLCGSCNTSKAVTTV
jgi:hypothetical protein